MADFNPDTSYLASDEEMVKFISSFVDKVDLNTFQLDISPELQLEMQKNLRLIRTYSSRKEKVVARFFFILKDKGDIEVQSLCVVRI